MPSLDCFAAARRALRAPPARARRASEPAETAPRSSPRNRPREITVRRIMLLRAGERSCQSTPLNLRSSNDDRWHRIASCARRPRTLREDSQCLVVSSPEKQRPQHLESSKGAPGQLKVRHTRCDADVHTRTRLAHARTVRNRAQVRKSLPVRPHHPLPTVLVSRHASLHARCPGRLRGLTERAVCNAMRARHVIR